MTFVVAVGLGLAIGIVIGAFGGGGGVLTVPALVYLLGQNAHDATTGSLVIVAVTAVVGTVVRAASGGVRWRIGLAFGAAGMPAAWLGGLLSGHVPQPALMLAFAVVALLAATALLVGGRGPGPEEPQPVAAGALAMRVTAPAVGTVTAVVGLGLLVGFLTGFLGVGGGFLAVPALVIALRMPMSVAIGTSLFVIAINSAAGLTARVGAFDFDLAVVLPFAAAAVIGTLLGKRVSDRLSGPTLATAFAGLLLAVGAVVAVESVIALG